MTWPSSFLALLHPSSGRSGGEGRVCEDEGVCVGVGAVVQEEESSERKMLT